MNYRKFIINKYKALTNVEINLKNSLIPIIGINESGKTSVLQAILSFDNFNDDSLKGNHLLAKNRYDYDSSEHEIQAYIEFEDEDEILEILSEVGMKKSAKLYKELCELFSSNEPVIITRNLDDLTYKIENIKSSYPQNFIETILNKVPYTLYFDDFTDRVPDKIIFPPNYINEGYKKNEDTLRNDWNEYVEEIFYRATDNELRTFITNQIKNDREAILSDVNDKLNEDIITDWKKLKILSKELVDENISDLKIKLNYDVDANGNMCFQFKIIDKNFKNKSRYFDISERSKGFQWFFNFAVKLKYNPKYINDVDGAIYLLDEPGSYLHATAQEELLKSLKEISKTNKVVYCTHSQYLLNPETININNIKIASREDGSILLQNFAEYKNSNKSFSALNPLYDALHLSILHDSNTVLNKNVVITEGITDYYFLKMISKNLSQYKNITDNIVPGSGVDNLKDLISFAIAWSKKYTVLIDSDEQGIKAMKKYAKFFGEDEAKNFKLYSLKNKNSEIVLEDFISKSDQTRLITLTSAKNVKSAFISLYFSEVEIQKTFFSKLDKETTNNLEYFNCLL